MVHVISRTNINAELIKRNPHRPAAFVAHKNTRIILMYTSTKFLHQHNTMLNHSTIKHLSTSKQLSVNYSQPTVAVDRFNRALFSYVSLNQCHCVPHHSLPRCKPQSAPRCHEQQLRCPQAIHCYPQSTPQCHQQQ